MHMHSPIPIHLYIKFSLDCYGEEGRDERGWEGRGGEGEQGRSIYVHGEGRQMKGQCMFWFRHGRGFDVE